MDATTPSLADEEAAVYDRQLRVWGVEVQKRLSSARVLLDGRMGGLAAEIAKNLVLAGVGSLHLSKAASAIREPHGEDFLQGEEGPVDILKEINPLVDVREAIECDAGSLNYDLVLLVGADGYQVKVMDARCRESGVKFLAAQGRSNCGFFFVDFLEHEYRSEKRPKEEPKSADVPAPLDRVRMSYSSFEEALQAPLSKFSRLTCHAFLVYKLVATFEVGHRRAAGLGDLSALEALRDKLCIEGGVPTSIITREMLHDYLNNGNGFAPINAIVGGIAVQEALKAISGKGEPINNFFFYEIETGEGQIVHA